MQDVHKCIARSQEAEKSGVQDAQKLESQQGEPRSPEVRMRLKFEAQKPGSLEVYVSNQEAEKPGS